MNKFLLLAGAAALLCGTANAQNLVADSDFEQGYSQTAWATANFGFYQNYLQHDGQWSAATGCVGGLATTYCYISQTLNTTAGAKYDLSFFVDNSYAVQGDSEQYRVTWGGQDLGIVDFNNTSWTQVNYTGLTALTNSTVLALYGRNDPAGIFFDDVSVVQSSPAPEPASWALMLGGFGLVGGAMRARRKAVSFA